MLAFVFPPILAIATKGKYYLRRTDDGIDLADVRRARQPLRRRRCTARSADQDYERPDMTASGTGTGYVCSLCLSTDRAGTHVLPEPSTSP